MRKSILVKLAGIAAAVSLLVGGAYATFSSNDVTITGVVLGSATPGLLIYNGSDWSNTTASGDTLGIKESNMYPGSVGSWHTFRLYNQTGGAVPFDKVIANVVDGATGSWDQLKDVVKMEFWDNASGTGTGPYTLNAWYTGPGNILLAAPFVDAAERDFQVRFSMDSSAGDTAKAQTLNFTLRFVGMTP